MEVGQWAALAVVARLAGEKARIAARRGEKSVLVVICVACYAHRRLEDKPHSTRSERRRNADNKNNGSQIHCCSPPLQRQQQPPPSLPMPTTPNERRLASHSFRWRALLVSSGTQSISVRQQEWSLMMMPLQWQPFGRRLLSSSAKSIWKASARLVLGRCRASGRASVLLPHTAASRLQLACQLHLPTIGSGRPQRARSQRGGAAQRCAARHGEREKRESAGALNVTQAQRTKHAGSGPSAGEPWPPIHASDGAQDDNNGDAILFALSSIF